MKLYLDTTDPLDTHAASILREAKNYLNIKGLKQVKYAHGYAIQGLDPQQLLQVQQTLFNTKHLLISETLHWPAADQLLVTRYLPGQLDQPAESLKVLISILYPDIALELFSFRCCAFYGQLSAHEKTVLRHYYINPLEEEAISLHEQNIIPPQEEVADTPRFEHFIHASPPQLAQFRQQHNLTMSLADLTFFQQYFQQQQRAPTLTELKIVDTYWSDHCRHSTFMTIFDEIIIEEDSALLNTAQQHYQRAKSLVYNTADRPDCLMDMATLSMKKLKKLGRLQNIEESDEVNACHFNVTAQVDGHNEEFVILFKNETHNHPTEVEPFGGAATCIGGAIRDPLSGRSFVFGAMRISGSADPREPYLNTLAGKLSPRKITTVAANGFSRYSNGIGLASGYMREYYHPGFQAKRLECGALVAYNYKKNIRREQPKAGDIVLLVGGRTGRDGIGGAVSSSKEQSNVALHHGAEVQKGNPMIERRIIRLMRKPHISRLIKKCNDFGAGGVAVAVGELAESLRINLDAVPLKYSGLNATEIALSESQERMAIMLAPQDKDVFIAEAQREGVEATVIAEVTDDKRVVMYFQGDRVCDLSSELLNSGGVRQHTKVLVPAPLYPPPSSSSVPFTQQLYQQCAHLNTASQQSMSYQFDTFVGGQTVFAPWGGRYAATPEQGLVMRLPLEAGETHLGVIMTSGYDPELATASPFHGAMYAVLESAMKIVSIGGKKEEIYFSFQEYFKNMRSPRDWGSVYAALLGAFYAQDQLQLAAIGGKDSMSGSYQAIHVPPSLISFAVAPCDCRYVVSKAFKGSHHNVYLLHTPLLTDGTPCFEPLKNNITAISQLIAQGKMIASSVVGREGIATTITHMCLGNGLGFTYTATADNLTLFTPRYCDVLIEVTEPLETNDTLILLGQTTEKAHIVYQNELIPLTALQEVSEAVLATVWSNHSPIAPTQPVKPSGTIVLDQRICTAVPNALVPIFPGTTGEYTLIRHLKKAGFTVTTWVFQEDNTTLSIQALVKQIQHADLLAFPSGVTLACLPQAARLITVIFNLADVSEQVNQLIKRGGLVLGSGENVTALVELGLIEHGKIAPPSDSLAMTDNASGRYYCGVVHVHELGSTPLWGETQTRVLPVAGYTNRVLLSETDFALYLQRGQILSVYCDHNGEVSGHFPHNPFGSLYAIEGLLSPNGQVMGRVADLSLLEEGLYQNCFKAQTDPLFVKLKQFFSGKA